MAVDVSRALACRACPRCTASCRSRSTTPKSKSSRPTTSSSTRANRRARRRVPRLGAGGSPQFSAPEVEVSEATVDPAGDYGEYAETDDPELHPRRNPRRCRVVSPAGPLCQSHRAPRRRHRSAPAFGTPSVASCATSSTKLGEHASTADEMVIIASIAARKWRPRGLPPKSSPAVLSFLPAHPGPRAQHARSTWGTRYPRCRRLPIPAAGDPYRNAQPTLETSYEGPQTESRNMPLP